MEGYKREGHPKIEARRQAASADPLAPDDPSILAIAADHPTEPVAGRSSTSTISPALRISSRRESRCRRLSMAERRLIDDCFLTDSERLRHDEALAILRERVGRS